VKSGIYRIFNLLNGRQYIGSSKNITKRLTHHKNQLRRGVHHSPFLQRDFNKCGQDCFVFEKLWSVDCEALLFEEQQALNNIKCEYNSRTIAYSATGYRHTDESKTKMKGRPSPFKGRHHSQEFKDMMSAAKKGQKASEETKRKM